MTGWKFLSMIIFTILNTLDGPTDIMYVSNMNYDGNYWFLTLGTDTHTHTSSASFPSSRVPLASSTSPRISCVSQHLHRCVEVVLSEVSLEKK